jgi:asparagine synthase (glutamine-hydrolysing)
MCGIAGVIISRDQRINPGDLTHLADCLAHRGPDGQGLWTNQSGNVGLVHRRLAILDTASTSDQPMHDQDSRFVIVFNGEIYNFLELRAELERLGSRFRTQSDTEVILEAWRHWGKAMLPKMNGMWALALHDRKSGETVLARDRFGIKPLYYTHNAQHFAFASEVRALRTLPWMDVTIDIPVVQRTLFDPFSVEAGERTLVKSVRRLPAGHLAIVRNGDVIIERWWRMLAHQIDPPSSPKQQSEKFLELFLDSIRLRMRSDVAIGTCLSGGFDSSAIVCAMSNIATRHHPQLREAKEWRQAFIASFPGCSNDETEQALEIATYAGVNPHVIRIDDGDALADIERILSDLEEVYISLPSAAWWTYRTLRQKATVVSIDGHGADELMAGYQQVGSLGFHMKNIAQRLAHLSPRAVADLTATALSLSGLGYLRGHRFKAPADIGTPFDADLMPKECGIAGERLFRMFHIGILPTVLRNFDRMSMAHGVEVRMPFMDWRLATYVMSLPDAAKLNDGQTKVVARSAMAGLMPEHVRISRKKTGFNSPMPEWMNGTLGQWATALLEQPNPAFEDIVDTRGLQNRIVDLNTRKAWNWRTVGHLWPYIHMGWRLATL